MSWLWGRPSRKTDYTSECLDRAEVALAQSYREQFARDTAIACAIGYLEIVPVTDENVKAALELLRAIK